MLRNIFPVTVNGHLVAFHAKSWLGSLNTRSLKKFLFDAYDTYTLLISILTKLIEVIRHYGSNRGTLLRKLVSESSCLNCCSAPKD